MSLVFDQTPRIITSTTTTKNDEFKKDENLINQENVDARKIPTNNRNKSMVKCQCHDWKLVVDVCGSEATRTRVKMSTNSIGDNIITVECYHGIKKDYFGHPTRVLTRTYTLPSDIDPAQVQCYLSQKSGNLIFSLCNMNNDDNECVNVAANNVNAKHAFLPMNIERSDDIISSSSSKPNCGVNCKKLDSAEANDDEDDDPLDSFKFYIN